MGSVKSGFNSFRSSKTSTNSEPITAKVDNWTCDWIQLDMTKEIIDLYVGIYEIDSGSKVWKAITMQLYSDQSHTLKFKVIILKGNCDALALQDSPNKSERTYTLGTGLCDIYFQYPSTVGLNAPRHIASIIKYQFNLQLHQHQIPDLVLHRIWEYCNCNDHAFFLNHIMDPHLKIKFNMKLHYDSMVIEQNTARVSGRETVVQSRNKDKCQNILDYYFSSIAIHCKIFKSHECQYIFKSHECETLQDFTRYCHTKNSPPNGRCHKITPCGCITTKESYHGTFFNYPYIYNYFTQFTV
eukprot:192109_1